MGYQLPQELRRGFQVRLNDALGSPTPLAYHHGSSLSSCCRVSHRVCRTSGHAPAPGERNAKYLNFRTAEIRCMSEVDQENTPTETVRPGIASTRCGTLTIATTRGSRIEKGLAPGGRYR